MLKRPGFLCVSDLDREDGAFHGKEFTGHKGFDRTELCDKAEKAGFKNIRFNTVMEIERVAQGGTKEVFPLFLMTAEKGE
jgi:hypothetical protein